MNARFRSLLPRAAAAAAGLVAGLLLFAPLQGFLRAGRTAGTPESLRPTSPEQRADLAPGPRARRLARKKTVAVAFRPLRRTLDLPAVFVPDETRVARVTARVPGRIEDLFVDSAGVPVRTGQPFARLYSPALESAQAEYLLALGRSGKPDWSRAAVEAARRRLRLLDVTEEQIRELEERGAASDRTVIHVQADGTVLDLAVRAGQYVEEGTVLASVADLSRLWAEIYVGEEDLPWVHPGQEVRLRTDGGSAGAGRVAFVTPWVDPVRRAVRVRVNVPNPRGDLKPGLFARAVLAVDLGPEGRALIPGLEDRTLCPEHPETPREGHGTCPEDGQPLVPAGGVVSPGVTWREARAGAGAEVLSVPERSVLVARGRRVALRDTGGPDGFEIVDVVLGPRADGFYPVLAGLAEGDRVAAAAEFSLDSEEVLPPPPEDAPVFLVDQEHCPVMGRKIDRAYSVDWLGRRVYFCCPSCEGEFLKDPDRFLRLLESWGERPVSVP